mgnify:CR=1 FL=1
MSYCEVCKHYGTLGEITMRDDLEVSLVTLTGNFTGRDRCAGSLGGITGNFEVWEPMITGRDHW